MPNSQRLAASREERLWYPSRMWLLFESLAARRTTTRNILRQLETRLPLVSRKGLNEPHI
jgi:hypothetical protein